MNYSEMPTLSMSTMNAAMMSSGSALPMAAVTGTTSADDYAPSGPRRARKTVGDDDTGDDGNGYANDETQDMTEPDVPIGDAVLPLMLMIGGYGMLVYFRRKRADVG